MVKECSLKPDEDGDVHPYIAIDYNGKDADGVKQYCIAVAYEHPDGEELYDSEFASEEVIVALLTKLLDSNGSILAMRSAHEVPRM